MTIAIYSVEFGLSLRLLLMVYMMIDDSLTANHYMCQTLMTLAIYSFEFGLRLGLGLRGLAMSLTYGYWMDEFFVQRSLWRPRLGRAPCPGCPLVHCPRRLARARHRALHRPRPRAHRHLHCASGVSLWST